MDQRTSGASWKDGQPSPERHAGLLIRLSAALASHADPSKSLLEMARLASLVWVDLFGVDWVGETGTRAANPSIETSTAQALETFVDGADGRSLRRRVAQRGEPELSGALIAAPMRARGRILGVVFAVRSSAREAFTAEDFALLRELARRTARVVDHAELSRQAEDKRRFEEQILATISHELRTPLTAILGWSHLLKGTSLEPSTRAKAIEAIERNARSEARLVEELLDLSQALSGHLRLRVAPVSLASVVASALEPFRTAASARRVSFSCFLDRRASPILGDAMRLRQLVGHLIANALKFTPPDGEVTIHVREEARHVILEVIDNGEGIRPKFLPRVFELFAQADPSTTRRHGGLGIGLTMVRELTRLHGGGIEVQSEGEDRGTRISLKFPVAGSLSLPRKRRGAREDGALQPGVLRGVRILVIEDDPEAAAMVATVLGLCGAEVRSRARLEALEVERFEPDVLLSQLPPTLDVPGAVHVELKLPVDPQELVASVRRALSLAA